MNARQAKKLDTKSVKTTTETNVSDAAAVVETAKVDTVETAKAEPKKTTRKTAAKTTEKAADAVKVVAEKVAAVEKVVVEKAAAKKETAAKTAEKAVAKKAEKKEAAASQIIVQFSGNEASVDSIVEKITATYVAEGHRASSIKDLRVYLKPEESLAYYVINDKVAGKVDLF